MFQPASRALGAWLFPCRAPAVALSAPRTPRRSDAYRALARKLQPDEEAARH